MQSRLVLTYTGDANFLKESLQRQGFDVVVESAITGRIVRTLGQTRAAWDTLTGGGYTQTQTPSAWSKLVKPLDLSVPFAYGPQPPQESLLVPYQTGGRTQSLGYCPVTILSNGNPLVLIAAQPMGLQMTGPDPQVRMLYRYAGLRPDGWSIWGGVQTPDAIMETLLSGGDYSFPPPAVPRETLLILTLDGPDDPNGWETDAKVQQALAASGVQVTGLACYPG